MKYNLKVIFKNKIEPTTIVETENIQELKEMLLDKLSLMADTDGDVMGIYVARDS